jgi:hypothetical protein
VPDRRTHYRQLQKRLQEYIDELDFPHSLYEAVMAVPPESVSMLTLADLKRFYLEGMSPSTQDEVDAASARELGLTALDYLQRKRAGAGNAVDDNGQQQKESAPSTGRTVDGAGAKRSVEAQRSGASRVAAGLPRASF